VKSCDTLRRIPFQIELVPKTKKNDGKGYIVFLVAFHYSEEKMLYKMNGGFFEKKK